MGIGVKSRYGNAIKVLNAGIAGKFNDGPPAGAVHGH